MKKIVLVVVILIGVLLSLFVIFNFSQKKLTDQQKEQALTRILGRKPNLSDAPTGNIEYKGENAAFQYPAKAKIYTYKDPSRAKNSSVLETFSFDIDRPRLVFNFSVAKNEANLGSVEDISGVKLREISSYGYGKFEAKIGKDKGLVFQKSGSKAEKSGFFIINNKIYEISVTGSAIEDVSKLFDEIIDSFVVF